ncbi:MAG: cyclase family protein [Deltaproteobacteria bacterium]|nr:cyclase family protein [Deltaproteobacteria bacterium]
MNEGLQEIQLMFQGMSFRADFSDAYSLSRTLSFNDDVDGAFGLPAATAKAVELGEFVGDTQRGGSVNCMTLVLHPHGDGTHIESAAHVEAEAPLLDAIHTPQLCLAAVLLLSATRFSDTDETYIEYANDDDWVLTRAALDAAWRELQERDGPLNPQAIILGRLDDGDNAYLTNEAMQFLRERSLTHLLVEEKSIDRLDDGGLLANHRVWFDLAPRGEKQADLSQNRKTLSEMIRSPLSFVERMNPVQRGRFCLLSLPIPPWRTDAAPIVPSLFSLSLDSQKSSSPVAL